MSILLAFLGGVALGQGSSTGNNYLSFVGLAMILGAGALAFT